MHRPIKKIMSMFDENEFGVGYLLSDAEEDCIEFYLKGEVLALVSASDDYGPKYANSYEYMGSKVKKI